MSSSSFSSFSSGNVANIPFSPTSPGKRSPGRPRTMKEYEDEITSLKKENFNLKVRIFFIEQNRMDLNLPKDVEELRLRLTDLTVDIESKKKELSDTEDLLLKSYKVVDTQKKQLEAIKSDQETEKQTLQNKIDSLEKELKDWQMKFMETSVHLDDTNALYAMTFGVNNKQGMEKEDDFSEKIKYLENELEKEKEKVMVLEGENTQLKSKLVKDQDELRKLQNFVEEIKVDLDKLLKERNLFEGSANEATSKLAAVEKLIKMKSDELKQKENEIEHLKYIIKDQEKKIADATKQEEKPALDPQRKLMKLLKIENIHLKEQVKEFQKRSECRSFRNGSKSSRELPTSPGWSDHEQELCTKLNESELMREELLKEIAYLKSVHDNGQTLIQTLIRENKTLKRNFESAKTTSGSQMNPSKEEDRKIAELIEKMPTEKDDLISELYSKIEELTEALREKECLLEQCNKCDHVAHSSSNESSKTCLDLKSSEEESVKREKEIEELTKELEEKRKEVEILKRELKKKTFNLQGLVNTELWDKNREIEKLNKVCERKHLEVLALQKQIRDYQKSEVQDKVNSFVSSFSLQNGLFTEDKENLQPVSDPVLQIRQLSEEKRLLTRKVEELQERLLNTPERDAESLLVQTLRSERDHAEKLRKEAVNACLLLTTRLQELADFLDSLLPTLCGKKRKVVQQAVERSRELSRSLSLAADDSSVMHCSAWSDLQPSLYVPLLPDISTVDFWSGEEDEDFSGGEEVARLKSQVETLTEEVKLKDSELSKFHTEKQLSDSSVFKKIFGCYDQNFLDNVDSDLLLRNTPVNIAEITEGSLVDNLSDQNISAKTQTTKLSPEVRSANIGTITLSSVKKDSNVSYNLITFEDQSKTKENDRCVSEYETWSEPDRDVSFARMGIKESPTNVNKSLQCNKEETSETADFAPKSSSPRRASEVQRLQRRIHSLEQVNEAQRRELVILHQLTPAVASRQDKATSIEGDEQEKVPLVKLIDVTKQLEHAENEVSSLKSEKEQWNKKIDELQCSLQQQTNELLEKQCALLELEKKTNQKLKEVEEKYKEKCSQIEEKCEQLEKKWSGLEKEKEDLLGQIADRNREVNKLTAELNNYDCEGKKNKKIVEDLNHKIQQMGQKEEELRRIVSEQEQLLADAERERQELATQLIARDRQVSDLQKQLSRMEQASNELESALRSQLDVATHQCAQFEAKIRDQDNAYKQIVQVERIKCELERRVAELEAVNLELENRLGSLNVERPVYSDYETDAGSSVVGGPRRNCPPPLTLPASPQRTIPCFSTQHSQDLTSDYLSDQDGALSSPQAQTHNVWPPTSPLTHASTSPDLGIESDHGRFSSLDHVPRSSSVSIRAAPVKDLMKLEEENTQLRRNLQKTRHALEETLAQLTAANHHKRHYEAQLSAANQHKAKVERAISRQLHKTHSILKKARVNLENDGKNEQY